MTASDNASPLLIACHNGHDECVKILLASGADPTLKVTLDGEDLTLDALQYAVKFGHDRCLRLLLNGSRLTPHEYSPQEFHPLRLAIRHEDVSCLLILIDSGFRLDQTFYDVDEELDNRYGSLLCFSPTYKAAQLVIQAGFDFSTWKPDHNIQSGNVKEYDPVTESLENTKVLDLLLNNGAKIGGAETFWLEVMKYIYFNFGFYLGDNEIDLTCKKLNPLFVFIKNGCDVKECLCQIFSLVTSDDFEQLVGNFLDVILKSLFLYPMILLSVNFEVPDKLLSKLKQSQKGVGPDHIDFLKKIQEESYTLRHACRVAVARHMISLDRWDSDRIERLQLPRILLDYLQYKEFGCYGEEFINGFSILRRCLDSPKGSKG